MAEQQTPLTQLRERATEFGVEDVSCSNCAAFVDLGDGGMGVCDRRRETQFRYGICLNWTIDEDFTTGDRDPSTSDEYDVAGRCVEPGCDGLLEKRFSEQTSTYFYGCCNYPDCNGVLPANPDGSPRGQPRSRALMAARTAAHAAFDKLWQEGHCDRGAAYSWLRAATGLDHQDAHMFQMDAEQCMIVIERVSTHGPGTEFWEQWKIDREARHREKAAARRRSRRDTSRKRRSAR